MIERWVRCRVGLALCTLGLSSVLIGHDASASVVQRLDVDALWQGADVVVEGTVMDVVSTWNRDRTGLQTRVRVAVARNVRGNTAQEIAIVHPGGVVDGNRHVIVGMPEFQPGERVRLYLRAQPALLDAHDSTNTYRVFGWNQGKWIAQTHANGRTVYVRAPHPNERVVGARRADDTESTSDTSVDNGWQYYTHNGMVWPESKIPVPYLIHQDGSEDVLWDDVRASIETSFNTWEQVPCSSLAFTYAGQTDLQVAVDGQNVLLWIESDWIYGEEAAAATSLWIPIEEDRTADVAFNGEGFTWAIEPEAAISYSTLDIQAVLTHELGHFSGLGHTERSVDTMYFSWRPWPGQRTLSADDKLGLCALYPVTADECATAGECTDDDTCDPYEYGNLCTVHPDAIGDVCNYERIECESFCLFTVADLSDGYCSRFCEQPEDCPVGFVCNDASQGMQSVKVCFVDPAQSVDAGPGVPMCNSDDDCPAGRYCGPEQTCTYDCVEAIDCPSGTACQTNGQCLAGEDGGGGCGCRATSRGTWYGGILIVFAVVGWRRRRWVRTTATNR